MGQFAMLRLRDFVFYRFAMTAVLLRLGAWVVCSRYFMIWNWRRPKSAVEFKIVNGVYNLIVYIVYNCLTSFTFYLTGDGSIEHLSICKM